MRQCNSIRPPCFEKGEQSTPHRGLEAPLIAALRERGGGRLPHRIALQVIYARASCDSVDMDGEQADCTHILTYSHTYVVGWSIIYSSVVASAMGH